MSFYYEQVMNHFHENFVSYFFLLCIILGGVFLYSGVYWSSAFAATSSAQDIETSQNIQYVEKLKQYFNNDSDLTEKFLREQELSGVFQIRELERRAKRYHIIVDAREKELSSLAVQYFNGDIENLKKTEDVFQDTFVIQYKEKNGKPPSLFLFHVPNGELRKFYKKLYESKKAEKEFLNRISKKFFQTNETEREKGETDITPFEKAKTIFRNSE